LGRVRAPTPYGIGARVLTHVRPGYTYGGGRD